MTAPVSTAQDLRQVVDAVMDGFAQVTDDGWDRPAHRLEWDCRDTAAHILDDFGYYAMNLAGRRPPQDHYIDLLETTWREGSPPMTFWPDPDRGTAAIVRCVDAAGGLLVAVTATAPPGHVGFHPAGNADASGFAAMGVVEGAAHAWDVLTAHGIDFRLDDGVVDRALNRLFPAAQRTEDRWHDFLTATGRTEETHGVRWRWDSSVRDDYGR
jgi:Mycothiol maleylpyruvate isomerase N-terminal domain